MHESTNQLCDHIGGLGRLGQASLTFPSDIVVERAMQLIWHAGIISLQVHIVLASPLLKRNLK